MHIELLNKLYNSLGKDIFFEQFSNIYVKEFFMFVVISTDKTNNNLIIPLLEVNNIFYKLITTNLLLYNKINSFLEENNCNKINYNFLGTYTETQIGKGQINLINKMKKYFSHDYISGIINKINIIISLLDKQITISIYNNDKVNDLKDEIVNILDIKHNIKLKKDRLILNFRKLTLDNNRILDEYNIKNNDIINGNINMNAIIN